MKQLIPLALLSFSLLAQASNTAAAQEGIPTQLLVTVDSKDTPMITANDLTIEVDKRKQPPTSLKPVAPAGAQIALLIDDGLRESVGREIGTLRSFITNLPTGTEISVGYMSNGRVEEQIPFTTNYAAAAAKLRLPSGVPGQSASPYFCLSEYVKHWPVEGLENSTGGLKARFVLMITNGVDPYNGSTSVLNQDSPYVATAVRDAQRAGVPVYSIYYGDAGIRGGRASFSGQSYLAQVAEGTGGRAYYEGTGNPVSMVPFLQQFQHDIAETYIATFTAGGRDLQQVKVKTNVPHLKLRTAQLVLPGNVEASSAR